MMQIWKLEGIRIGESRQLIKCMEEEVQQADDLTRPLHPEALKNEQMGERGTSTK